MNRLLIRIVAPAVAFGGFFLYVQYDRATNYQETSARVTGIEKSCYMKKRSGKRTWTTKEGPCEIVEMIHKEHSEFKDYNLIRNVYVEYEYKSPADGRWYRGKHKQARHADGRSIEFGDDLVILAHKEKPEETDNADLF